MTTTLSPTLPRAAREPSFVGADLTLRSWALTTDHKRVGVLFLFMTTLMMALGGVFALLLRIEHLTPGRTIVDAVTYNRLFTMHGVVMIFLFMIPAIPSGFGNFLVPLMIGAKDVAFPRLNLLSFYLYAIGAIVVLVSMQRGGLDTGWTFYPPYSVDTTAAVFPTLVGLFIVGWSSILTGLNFIVTIHTMRAEGLTWMKLPIFVWTIYGTSIIQILATPVLGMAVLLIAVDHAFSLGLFDPARGGDPVLFQHLFWFYSHPAVYIMILPGMGIVSEVVCTFCRKNPASYRAIVYSTLGIAFVGFLTWGHHMFVAGISAFDAGAFGVLSMLVAVFSAIKVFTWIGTMYKGSIAWKTPLLYVVAFLFLFVFGGMTGVAVATTSLDVHWHDTYFVVAHFHFIMVGGTLTAWLAGLHYWFPKLTGRTYAERWGVVSAVLVSIGFFVTFFPQFLLGNAGMPRRYYNYPAHFQALHVVSTVGSWLLAAGMLLTLVNLLRALFAGPLSGDNPWGSSSYEWLSRSPPPKHNFDEAPVFATDPYDYTGGARG